MAAAINASARAASEIFAGRSLPAKEIIELAGKLQRERQLGLARRLYDRLANDPTVQVDPQLRLKVAQKRALFTYKDPDLATDSKLARALEILQSADDLGATNDQETLGLAGAIYKRMWEQTGVERHLETSLGYYMRGFRIGVRTDYGYTGINAAFVLDLLADLESPNNQPEASLRSADARRSQAQDIRRQIVATLPSLPEQPNDAWLSGTWWFLVTLGETYFGLHDYDSALHWYGKAIELPEISDWEYESSARQLAALLAIHRRAAGLRGVLLSADAERVLRSFLKGVDAAVDSVIRGKVGLALSGGGFRASLYHIGVLARLAELDLLRHVEFLSCVSGGSIVGAHYYLEVRNLLQNKKDGEVTPEDYIDIVRRISTDFLAGVQRNIRIRIAAEWITNLKMIFVPDYSRTLRAGELYEREIYSRVADGGGAVPRWLNDLKIQPLGEREDFRPKDHNWRRAAKVPILLLNATSLNTGHNWQFTASWMGEPPAGIDSEVDANYRLRRMYYADAPPQHRRVRLGHAVAASACVPGIFEPLPLANLYERMRADGSGRIRPVVRLVDGGVYDNQGTAALLEQSCSVLLISDGSGQMDDQDAPSNSMLGVPLRANSILQARVRIAQYEDVAHRLRGGTLKGLMFVHLKKDLETRPVDWIDSRDPSAPAPNQPLTGYGIHRGIQRRIAAIRTDLDSFTEVEAFALMTSGYLMVQTQLGKPVLGFDTKPCKSEPWEFLRIARLLQEPSSMTPLAHSLDRQLSAGSRLAFKVWFLSRSLQLLAGAGALGIAALLVYLFRAPARQLFTFSLSVGDVGFGLLTTGLSLLGLGVISKLIGYRKTVREVVFGLFMAIVGCAFARLHLHLFDRLFLRRGKVDLLIGQTNQIYVEESQKATADREESLRETSAKREVGYALQQSKWFTLYARTSLDATTQQKVTETLFRLQDDPHAGAQPYLQREEKYQTVPVPGTRLRIAYRVDEASRRVQVMELSYGDESA